MTNEELQTAIGCCLIHLCEGINSYADEMLLKHLRFLLQEQRCRLGELK